MTNGPSASAATQEAGLGLAWRLAQRELRGGFHGFRIFLACLFLGVAAIAGVGSLSQAMLEGLRQDGRSILGGDVDLSIVHKAASGEQLAWLAERGEISRMTHMRAMARSDREDQGRVLVELKSVDGRYPLYGSAGLAPQQDLAQALAMQDGLWGAAAEPRLLRRLGIEVGDTLRVGETRFRVTAALEREPDRTARAFILGPTLMIAAESLADTALVQPGSMIHYHYRLKLNREIPVTAFREQVDQVFPEAGWRILDSRRAAPRVNRFIDRLTLFMTLVGLTSLLVGGVGVGNAVRSYLEGKAGTIATLKCLGAPSPLIFRIYMLQILAMAFVAILFGLAAGATLPWIAAALLGDSLGWEAVTRIFPLPLAIAAIFGFLTAVTFSLWPLAHARSVSPASLFRDLVSPVKGAIERRTWITIGLFGTALAALAVGTAIDRWMALWFVLGVIGALVLFRLTAQGVILLARRTRRPRHPGLRLALTNLHRPGAPTGSVVMSLGLGLTVLIAIALIEGNLARQVQSSLPEEAPGFYFIDIQPDQVADFDTLVRSVPGTSNLQRVPMLRGRISAVNGRDPSTMDVPDEISWIFRGDRGLTWTREPLPEAEVIKGDWWPADYDGDSLVSLDAEIAEGLGLDLGDTLTVNVLGRDVVVTIANLRRIDWSELKINFVMVFSPGVLEKAPQTHLATVRADGAAADAVEVAVTDRFVNVSAIRVKEALAQVAELMRHIATAIRAIAALAILAGVLVLAGAVAAGHHRRVYDAVVLKVLGATRRLVGQAFAIEYGLLGLFTAGIAAVVGTGAAYLILTEIMHTPFIFLPGAVLSTALIATGITLLFGFAGTYYALSQKAAPLLRNE